jgi:cytoskeletal protein CcmA (bactofilin family)
MSVFCTHCRKRLILENYVVKSYQGLKGYATCGDVVVEKSGRISARIQSGNLIIKGMVQGSVEARGRVEISGSGRLVGDVFAYALAVGPGASIDAQCRIVPQPTIEEMTAIEPVLEATKRAEKPLTTASRKSTKKPAEATSEVPAEAPEDRPADKPIKRKPVAVKAIRTGRARRTSTDG